MIIIIIQIKANNPPLSFSYPVSRHFFNNLRSPEYLLASSYHHSSLRNGARRCYKCCCKSVGTESAATLVCSPNGVSSSYLANAKWLSPHYCHHTCHWSVNPVEITWELALCVWQVTPRLFPHNCVLFPNGEDSSSELCDTVLLSETLVWPTVSVLVPRTHCRSNTWEPSFLIKWTRVQFCFLHCFSDDVIASMLGKTYVLTMGSEGREGLSFSSFQTRQAWIQNLLASYLQSHTVYSLSKLTILWWLFNKGVQI